MSQFGDEEFRRKMGIAAQVDLQNVTDFGDLQLILCCPVTEDEAVVLVHRDKCPFPRAPFVTWSYYAENRSFAKGHYDMDFITGVRDFMGRVERGY